MSNSIIDVPWAHVIEEADNVALQIRNSSRNVQTHRIYGVPSGGITPAALVYASMRHRLLMDVVLEDDPDTATCFVDDLVDSGKTQDKFESTYPGIPFYALFTKGKGVFGHKDWLRFPWERMSAKNPSGIEDNVLRLIQYIGDDPTRDGLQDTPKRVVKSFREIFAGYRMKVEDAITTFEQTCDEMVILKNVEFYSTCEHHMLPFHGRAHIAYLPDQRVIGISKLARILEIYSRRLQNQERICSDVTSALMTHLSPLGAACVLEGQHFCMQCRGVGKQNSEMITSSLVGKFRDPAVRSEFMSLIARR
jgi:GTP cyclohydrolase I